MSDEIKNDAVKAEEYNKVVEAHNNIKMEKERIEKELNELKGKAEMDKKISEEKQKWEQEKAELLKQQEELKQMNDTKSPKGVVNPSNTGNNDFMEKLDKVIPRVKASPERFASRIARFQHYKSPVTKEFTNRDVGMGIALLADAQRINPDLVPHEARKSSNDIQFKR